MPCGCGGASTPTAADGTVLSGSVDPRYGTPSAPGENLLYSQGFWVAVLVILGAAWGISYIQGSGKKRGE